MEASVVTGPTPPVTVPTCATCAKAYGIRFDQDPVDQSWLWREARLTDPDGNMLCLYCAGQNRKKPPWRVADPD